MPHYPFPLFLEKCGTCTKQKNALKTKSTPKKITPTILTDHSNEIVTYENLLIGVHPLDRADSNRQNS